MPKLIARTQIFIRSGASAGVQGTYTPLKLPGRIKHQQNVKMLVKLLSYGWNSKEIDDNSYYLSPFNFHI